MPAAAGGQSAQAVGVSYGHSPTDPDDASSRHFTLNLGGPLVGGRIQTGRHLVGMEE